MIDRKTIADPRTHYGDGRSATRDLKWQRLTGAVNILGLAFLIPLSYLLAQLAVKGLSGLSWDLGMDLRYILLAAAFAFGAMALWLRQRREKRA